MRKVVFVVGVAIGVWAAAEAVAMVASNLVVGLAIVYAVVL